MIPPVPQFSRIVSGLEASVWLTRIDAHESEKITPGRIHPPGELLYVIAGPCSRPHVRPEVSAEPIRVATD
jgi:hypothetical protein